MKKPYKLLIASAALMVTGCLLVGTGLALGGSPANIWLDNQGFHIHPAHAAVPMQIQEKTPVSPFTSTDIHLKYADITVIPSDGYYLEYQLSTDRAVPEWDVTEGNLTFRSEGRTQRSFNLSFWGFYASQEEYVKLYVPADALFDTWDLKIGYGDASAEGIRADNWTLDLEYGYMALLDSEIKQLVLDTSYSDVNLDRVTSEDIHLTYGQYGALSARSVLCDKFTSLGRYMDLELIDFTAGEVGLSFDYSDILAALKGCSIITADNTYTDLELKTDQSLLTYETDVQTHYSSITVNNKTHEDSFTSDSSKGGLLTIRSSYGDIDIRTNES